MIAENINTKIVEYTKELKLPGVRKHFQDTLIEASGAEVGYDEYLLLLLEKEYALRLENRKKSRLRLAGFPYKKYLDDSDNDKNENVFSFMLRNCLPYGNI